VGSSERLSTRPSQRRTSPRRGRNRRQLPGPVEPFRASVDQQQNDAIGAAGGGGGWCPVGSPANLVTGHAADPGADPPAARIRSLDFRALATLAEHDDVEFGDDRRRNRERALVALDLAEQGEEDRWAQDEQHRDAGRRRPALSARRRTHHGRRYVNAASRTIARPATALGIGPSRSPPTLAQIQSTPSRPKIGITAAPSRRPKASTARPREAPAREDHGERERGDEDPERRQLRV
jgi:hypothetical protein